MPEIRAILFDAGGTLVLQDPEAMGDRLGMEIDPARAFAAHYLTMAEFSAHRQAGSDEAWDWFLQRYFARLGHPEPIAAGPVIQRGYGLWNLAIEGVPEALSRLGAGGVRMAVVSNSDGSVETSLQAAGLGHHFEAVVDSEVVGVRKPDPRIFRVALERLELEPSDVWYVGDSVFHDLGGAKAAGLAAGWLVDPLELHPEVVRRVSAVEDLCERLGL